MAITSTSANGLNELRERNRLRVIEALRRGSPLSQATISRLTGLSRSTVWTVVRELKQHGLISEHVSTEPAGRGGRPGIRLVLTQAAITDRPDVRFNQPSILHSFESDRVLETLQLAEENARLKSLLSSIAAIAAEAAAPANTAARHHRRKG